MECNLFDSNHRPILISTLPQISIYGKTQPWPHPQPIAYSPSTSNWTLASYLTPRLFILLHFLLLPHLSPLVSSPSLISHTPSTYYQHAIHQKVVFTCVCKAWHAYAQELLLKFVLISKAIQTSTLATLLTSNPWKGLYILHLQIETWTMLPQWHMVVYSNYCSMHCPLPTSSNSPQLLDALAQPGTSYSLHLTHIRQRVGSGLWAKCRQSHWRWQLS
jgi:hypothetical protein